MPNKVSKTLIIGTALSTLCSFSALASPKGEIYQVYFTNLSSNPITITPSHPECMSSDAAKKFAVTIAPGEKKQKIEWDTNGEGKCQKSQLTFTYSGKDPSKLIKIGSTQFNVTANTSPSHQNYISYNHNTNPKILIKSKAHHHYFHHNYNGGEIFITFPSTV